MQGKGNGDQVCSRGVGMCARVQSFKLLWLIMSFDACMGSPF